MKSPFVADLGVGTRESVIDRLASFKASLTERQKCWLAVPAGIFLAYAMMSGARFLIIFSGNPPPDIIPFLDWWWKMFL